MTEKAGFRIGAEGVDVDAVAAQVEAAVAEKARRGAYDDPRLARARRADLLDLDSSEDLAAWYLDSLAEAARVDINDFEIHERRARFGRLLVAFKRLIWKMLRFYTYRLWSQQNQVNELLLAALETLERRSREKTADLEARLARLEGGAPPPCPPADE
ncbi:MAG: hypothetical protein FJ225_00545 [Lentisphaerae bacterium]|nr:hypothetical protein [Lentisphaerota bacterium]